MPNDWTPNDIRSVWQSQTTARSKVSFEVIRRKTNKLEEAMRQQVVQAYIGAFMIVVIALYISWQLDGMFFRMGASALLLWAVSLVYQARKALPRQSALNATLSASLDFYRQELERQSSYLRAGRNTIWPVLLSTALFLTPFVRGARLVNFAPFLSVMAIWVVSVFVVVGRKLRAVQKEIEELDTFTKEAK